MQITRIIITVKSYCSLLAASAEKARTEWTMELEVKVEAYQWGSVLYGYYLFVHKNDHSGTDQRFI